MPGKEIFLLIGLTVLVLYAVPRIWIVVSAKKDPGGDSSRGLLIFSESLRWMSVPWGKASCAAGFRRAGFKGEFVFWKWHETWRAWLVFPTIAAPKMLERQSQRLADYITEKYRENPAREIYLVGYSCGGYVATRALELLDDDVKIRGVAQLAPAMSPWRDLQKAASHVDGEMIICSSCVDAIIVGVGTVISGTADRKHVPSMGMLGYLGKPCDNVSNLRWNPKMILLGHTGGHFAAPTERFIAKLVAPRLMSPE
ncbi:MAG: hypothetical protein KAR11_06800 [Phycisphaerae bacterium]|nr:hypothetical protein [Phycisphaerae bacterium]